MGLLAPSRYLKLLLNFSEMSIEIEMFFPPGNAFENVVCKMVDILSRPQFIFNLDLTPDFNEMGKDNCKTGVWGFLLLVLEVWRYIDWVLFWWGLGVLRHSIFGLLHPQKRNRCRTDTSGVYWRLWSLSTSFPVNIRVVVTLTTFPFQCPWFYPRPSKLVSYTRFIFSSRLSILL